MKHFLFPIVKLIIHKLHKKKRVEEEDNNCKIIQLVRCTFTLVNLYFWLCIRVLFHCDITMNKLLLVRFWSILAAIVCGGKLPDRPHTSGYTELTETESHAWKSLTPRVRPLRLTWKTDNCWKLLNICTLIIEYLLFSLTMNDSSKTCFQRCEVLLKFQLALFNAFR